MCGRFTLRASPVDISHLFALAEVPPMEPRYNIAPTQQVLAVGANSTGDRHAATLRWGLVPPWAEDEKIGYRLVNARSETAADKPAFRKRRCLIPTSGFYEWQNTGGKTKQPYYICREDGLPLAFAGLWEEWTKGEAPIDSCTILTTDANELMSPIHNRMPVILDAKDFDRWLDPALQDPAKLQPLLVPYSGSDLTAYPISTWVNSPRNQGPKCIEPVAVD